jgi:hypothetical protein
MLERFIKIESLIRSLFTAKDASDYDINYLSLNSDKWIYLKKLSKVFSFYYFIIVKMLAQSYLTMYNVLPQYIILRSQLVHAIKQNRGIRTHSLLANAI